MRYAASCEKPPTTSNSTPTAYRSPEASRSSAARFRTRRVFPPNRLERGIDETLIEIKERPLPERRNRRYDRVVKRTQVGDKLIKRTKHKQRLYDDPPAVHVFGAA